MISKDELNFSKQDGLIPAIVTDEANGAVLMLAYMNEEAFNKTMDTSIVTFFSRSRGCLWTKGETSGNFLHLVSIHKDCDSDALLLIVRPDGPACHKGTYSCFGAERKPDLSFFSELFSLIKTRQKDLPEGSYTTSLFKRGENRIIQKVGEEAVELVIAAKNNDREEIINETSDLFYHLFVLLNQKGVGLEDICSCLNQRHKNSK